MKDKKHHKVRDHCHFTGEYRGTAHSICNLKCSVPKKIPIAFHDGSNYGYHFIKKQFPEEFKTQFTCLGENTEKYITFIVPVEKEVTRVDINGDEVTKNISNILQFMDSTRFMASSLSNLVNNFAEEIHKIKCKYEHNDKKCESCRFKHKYRDCFLEYTNFKDDLIEYKCLCCNKNYQQKFAENLKEWFFNTYKFYNSDNNKFILLV